MNQTPTTVLIADDHPMVLRGLAEIIEQAPNLRLVGTASNGEEARKAYQRLRPDVLLIDLEMPEWDGRRAIRAIRSDAPNARIIILTAFAGEEDVFDGLRAGARAYLLKDASAESILECINTVAGGGKYVAPPVAVKLANRFGSAELSPREKEILDLVVAGKNNKLISRATGITIGTTKFHLTNIFGKLGVSSRTEAIHIALKRGLVRL
jgi:two-component system NarL family response regulator